MAKKNQKRQTHYIQALAVIALFGACLRCDNDLLSKAVFIGIEQ